MLSASAPTRIDLAGGTLDIWPLCHLLGRPALTLNLAINLRARVSVEERTDRQVEIVSEDRDERLLLPADRLRHDRLGLATRLIEWFGAESGLTVRMRSTVPSQSGLGGSSALAVALAGALEQLRGKAWDRATLQNIETTLLGRPTGYQDYYPSMRGGLNLLESTPAGVSVTRLEQGDEFLGRHLVLIDTGLQHHSGLTNWEVVRRFLDGDRIVRSALAEIAACAARMSEAVQAGDIVSVARALDDEWVQRRRLSPAITNPAIDALAESLKKSGALASKLCGAGGGGCLVALVKNAQTAKLEGTRIQFEPDPKGLTVE